jgi:replicative DNA helicase
MKKVSAVTNTSAIGEKEFKQIENHLESMLQDLRVRETGDITVFGYGTTDEDVKRLILKHTTYDERRFIHSGLDGLQSVLPGLCRGELVIIHAESGSGKTMLAQNMATKQFDHGASVYVVNMEMEQADYEARLLAAITNRSVNQIRARKDFTWEDRRDMRDKVGRWSVLHGNDKKCRIVVKDARDVAYTPLQLEADVRAQSFDSIIIDYLTLFDVERNQKLWEAQKDYSRYLKLMAKRLGCVVIVLAQKNKEGDVKYGKGPEEDADLVLTWEKHNNFDDDGQTEIQIKKARHGRRTKFPATFVFDKMVVETYAPEADSGMSKYNTAGTSRGESWEGGD